jgi:hypothetical protein
MQTDTRLPLDEARFCRAFCDVGGLPRHIFCLTALCSDKGQVTIAAHGTARQDAAHATLTPTKQAKPARRTTTPDVTFFSKYLFVLAALPPSSIHRDWCPFHFDDRAQQQAAAGFSGAPHCAVLLLLLLGSMYMGSFVLEFSVFRCRWCSCPVAC